MFAAMEGAGPASNRPSVKSVYVSFDKNRPPVSFPLLKTTFAQRGRQQLLPSACADRRSKDIRVVAIIITELKLGDIERKVFFADLVEGANATALDQRPEAFNRISMHCADDVFAYSVVDDGVRVFFIEVLVTYPLVSNQQTDFVRDGFMLPVTAVGNADSPSA